MQNIAFKTLIIIFTICLLPVLALALDLSQTFSSGLANPSVLALTPSSRNETIYYLNSANQITSAETDPYLDLPDWQSGILAGPSHAYIGFRSTVPGTRVSPLFLPDSSGIPNHSRFTLLEDDPSGDSAVPNNFLDILQTKITFSETKLYYSIKNNSNEFPVSSGFTFYSYMGFFTDPNAEPGSNPPVFGLMYTVTATGLIGPGLYKVTGTGTSDLELLGEITHSVDASNGTLTLSCNLSDLQADPDFSAWYNPQYPLMLTSAITSRITLTGGNTTADTTPGAELLLKPQLLNANSVPASLSNPVFSWANGVLSLQVSYSDEDHNAPISVTASVDQGDQQELNPLNFSGFDQPVIFAAQSIACPQDWNSVSISLNYGASPQVFTYQNPVSNEDLISPVPSFAIYPNPVQDKLFISFEDKVPLRFEDTKLFNLKGQLQPLKPDRDGEMDTSGLPAGVYFIRIMTERGILTRSFVKRN